MCKTKSVKFFEIEKNVKEYIEACEGLDGKKLIELLNKHLKPNSTVLELGMGAGKDLDILNKTYSATGSDNSQIFLDKYKPHNPNADLILLDALTLETERNFDCIYSNKVLHHLSKKDLDKSFKRQSRILNDKGLLFHSFWYGIEENTFQDLHFTQYKVEDLKQFYINYFEVIEFGFYEEMLENDSFYMILKKL